MNKMKMIMTVTTLSIVIIAAICLIGLNSRSTEKTTDFYYGWYDLTFEESGYLVRLEDGYALRHWNASYGIIDRVTFVNKINPQTYLNSYVTIAGRMKHERSLQYLEVYKIRNSSYIVINMKSIPRFEYQQDATFTINFQGMNLTCKVYHWR